jgi:hypothetical protein
VGSVIALVPTLAVVPARRLLGVSMLGVAVVVALLLERAWFPPREDASEAESASGRRNAALASLAALGLGFAHLVHGPGTSWLQTRQHQLDATDFETRLAFLRRRERETPGKRARIGVLRGMAGMFFAPFAMDRRGRTPQRWTVLSQPGHVLALRRDERTLDLVVGPGRSLYPIGERSLYRSEDSPLRAGDEITVRGLHVTILADGEGGPRSARFELDRNLDDLSWVSDTFVATKDITLPREGFGEPFEP